MIYRVFNNYNGISVFVSDYQEVVNHFNREYNMVKGDEERTLVARAFAAATKSFFRQKGVDFTK